MHAIQRAIMTGFIYFGAMWPDYVVLSVLPRKCRRRVFKYHTHSEDRARQQSYRKPRICCAEERRALVVPWMSSKESRKSLPGDDCRSSLLAPAKDSESRSVLMTGHEYPFADLISLLTSFNATMWMPYSCDFPRESQYPRLESQGCISSSPNAGTCMMSRRAEIRLCKRASDR